MRNMILTMVIVALAVMVTPALASQDGSSQDSKSFIIKEQQKKDEAKYGTLSQQTQEVYDKAIRRLEAKAYDDAIRLLNEVIEAYPVYVPAYQLRGLAYIEKGKITKSKLDENHQSYNKSIFEFEQAVDNFTKIIELDPSLAYPYLYRGIAYLELEYYTVPALDDLNKYMDDFNKKTSEAYFYRGSAYLQRGLLPEALTDLKLVIDMEPSHKEAYAKVLKAYDLGENYKDAIIYFGTLVTRNPKNALPWYFRGVAFLQTNEKQKAISDFKKALAIFPNFEDAKKRLKEAQGKK